MVSCNSCFDRHDFTYMTEVVCLWKQGCSSLYRLLSVKSEVQTNTLWFDPVSVDDELQLSSWQTLHVTDVVNLWKQGCSSLYDSACLLRVKWLDRVSVDDELQLLFWQTRQLVLYDWSCLSVETVAAHYTNCGCLLRVKCKPILCDRIGCL